jgi:predicted RND superfamily exporter protein
MNKEKYTQSPDASDVVNQQFQVNDNTKNDEHPRFIAAMKEISEHESIETMHSDTAFRLLSEAIEYGSQDFSARITKLFQSAGELPTELGFTEDNLPVFSLTDYAKIFEVTEDEAIEDVKKEEMKRGGKFLSFDINEIHHYEQNL